MEAFVAIIMSIILAVTPMTFHVVLIPKHIDVPLMEESRFRDCPPWLEWMCGSEYYA